MKFAPPLTHDGAVDVQVVAAGTDHCVSQTRSLSVSGDAGAAVVRFEIFIETRRHAVFAGWHALALGQLVVELRTSRFGMLALEWPAASYVASFAGSVAAFVRIASPFGDTPEYTPAPPFWLTNIAWVPSSELSRLVESA